MKNEDCYCSWMFQVTFKFRSIKMKKVYQQYHINPSDHLFLLCSLHWNDADEKYSLEHAAHHHRLWSQQCLCSSGVQNMCQRVNTALFWPGTFTRFMRFLHDFTRFLRDFTRNYAILAIFTLFFARHKMSDPRHLKLLCRPVPGYPLPSQWLVVV